MQGDIVKARHAFTRALQLDPRSLDALSGLVATDLAAKRPADARRRLDAYLAQAQHSTPLLLLAARTYIASGDPTKAEAVLERVVQGDPSNLQAYDILGRLYLSQRKLEQARERFAELARRQPESPAAATMVGMILQMQNKTQEAELQFEAILERHPKAAAAANNLARLYADRGQDLDRALTLALLAREQMPEEAQVDDTLGWVYYKKGLPESATPELERSVQKQPGNAVFHYHLGMAYAATGQAAKARRELEHALKLQPQFDGADLARRTLRSLSG